MNFCDCNVIWGISDGQLPDKSPNFLILVLLQVESALIEHKAVAETAVVAHPHKIKGECLYCFITVKEVRHNVDYDSQSICFAFPAHLYLCTVGSYASPSVCLPVLENNSPDKNSLDKNSYLWNRLT